VKVSGTLAAVTAAVLYGTAYVAIAVALDGFTPVGVAIVRGLAGSAVLVALLAVPGLADQRPSRMRADGLARLAIIGLFGGGIFVLALNEAIALSGATVAAFVAGLYAVVAAALAVPILGERLSRPTVLALLAALAGTVMMSGLLAGDGSTTGIGIALVAAASFGLFLVLSRRWSAPFRLTGMTVGLASLVVSAAVAALVALATGDPVVREPLEVPALLAMAWVAVGPGAAAAVLVVIGMQRLPAQRASLLLLLNPPTAAALAYVLLGERLDPVQVGGAALILGAIAIASGGLPTRMGARRSSRPGSVPPHRS
jgi:drug/metabolite transporter (DMT)-like permease